VLDDDELRSVGRLAADFAALELLTTSMVWRLLGTDEEAARQITAHLTHEALLDLGRRLGRLRLVGQPLDDFDAWLDNVARLTERRDALIHAPWASDVGETSGLMNLDLFQGKFRKLPFDPAEFERLAGDVQSATVRGMVIATGPREAPRG
jgi:hypothetical protein